MVYVYVLRSLENRRRYVGITARLGERLRTHSHKATKGGQQLGRFEIILREEFTDYASARTREKFLKSGQGRAWLNAKFGTFAPAAPETAIDTTPPSPTFSASSSGV